MSRSYLALVIWIVAASLVSGAPQVVGKLAGAGAAPWAQVEALRVAHPALGRELLLGRARPWDPRVQAVLPEGTFRPERAGRPLSGGDVWSVAQDLVVLHRAPGWDAQSPRPPVLLVHGSGDSGTRAWALPWISRGSQRPGLMQALAEQGRAVFAVTFLHNHGDNFAQAALLAGAIDRIRELRGGGAGFQVDLVAHSKGNVAARLYLSDAGRVSPAGVPVPDYRGDVRRYVAVAGPHRGTDLVFRFRSWSDSMVAAGAAAPLGTTALRRGGHWIDTRGQSVGGPCFRGDAQMLEALVTRGIPFGPGSTTEGTDLPPWRNASRDALYWGGRSESLASVGLPAARDAAGNVVARLEARGLDPRVQLAVLFGTESRMKWVGPDGEITETVDFTAPGDGMVYAASAGDASGMLRRGAALVGWGSLHRNHLDVARVPEALAWISRALR